ncbi:MAG: PAS domain-containing protein [Ekhidna sp.]
MLSQLDPEKLDAKSRKMLDYFLNKDNVSVFCKDIESKFFNCNASFLSDCDEGSVTTLIGKTDYDLSWTKEQAAYFRLVDRDVMENDMPRMGIVEEQTSRSRRKRWIETNKFPLKDPDGSVVGLLGFYVERL